MEQRSRVQTAADPCSDRFPARVNPALDVVLDPIITMEQPMNSARKHQRQ
jgi:hypothetical protein